MGMTNGNTGKNRLGWWDYPATVLLLGVLSLGMLTWTDHLGQRLQVNHSSSDTLRDLWTRAATAHLWLEEGLTDEEEPKLQRARTGFAEALRLSQVLRDGGESEYGNTVQPLKDPALRMRAEELTRLLVKLNAGTRERIEKRAGITSPLNLRDNIIFDDLESRVGDLEKILVATQAADHTESRRLFYGMLVAWAAILGVSTLGLIRRERRQRQAEEALHRANAELEERVAERTAQLRQLNEQLGVELTERKRADLELQKFVSLADHSSELIGMCDLQLVPFYVNDAGIRLLGLDGLEQVRRTPIADFFFPEDRRFITDDFFPRVLQAGRAEVEIRFRHFQTGEPLWMIYTGFCIVDATGQPVAVATVSRNITERKHAEEALRTSEARLAGIVASAMVGIITVDEAQQVVLFNTAAEKIFGCPAAEALGQPLDRFIPERLRHAHRRHMDTFATTGVSSRSMHSPGELAGVRATGEEFPLEATISQAKIGGHNLLTVVLRDLTERKRAEELARLYTQSEERDLHKTEFIYNLSHELRTPLTTIREGVSQVTDGILGPTTADQREFLAIVLTDIDRLARIINDLLDVAKIESGRFELWLEHVNMVAIAQQAVRLFEPRARAKGLQIRMEFAKPEIAVYADPDKIAQVIANLLANALKFTAHGEVELKVDDLGDHAVCAVRDTGRGIPPEDLPKVFQKFYQAGLVPGPGGKGTGLGLPIAKGIVEAHGGTMSARSEPGVGSTFTFALLKKSS